MELKHTNNMNNLEKNTHHHTMITAEGCTFAIYSPHSPTPCPAQFIWFSLSQRGSGIHFSWALIFSERSYIL